MTVKELKDYIKEINKTRNIYKEFHLIWVWGGFYRLYQGDFVRSIWKRIGHWNFKEISKTFFEELEKDIKENKQELEQLPF